MCSVWTDAWKFVKVTKNGGDFSNKLLLTYNTLLCYTVNNRNIFLCRCETPDYEGSDFL